MRNCFCVFVLTAGALVAGGAPAQGDFFVLEPPDLSNDRLAPSGPFTAGPGAGVNILGGSVGITDGSPIDRDYFTVIIPDGFQFDQLILLTYASGLGNLSFVGVQAGPIVTVDPDFPIPDPLLGYYLFGADDVLSDILPDIGEGVGAIGFTAPLPAGTYTFWVQETGEVASYLFDFRISATDGPPPGIIPEPASLTLAALGTSLGLGYARLRRGRSKAVSAA